MSEMSKRNKEKNHRMGKQMDTCRGQVCPSHQFPTSTVGLPHPMTRKLDQLLE
jgi:hypothetical protein